jgi:predicted nucleic acid-binding protein
LHEVLDTRFLREYFYSNQNETKQKINRKLQALIAKNEGGLDIQTLTPRIAEQAGLFKCQYTNLPMGDCIIAATALLNHARILSDDPHFDCIAEIKRAWI